MTTVKSIDILPQDALEGISVGVSVSESPDLEKLGLLENHFRLALAEFARTILVSGGDIYYGGHLRRDGYTLYLLDELQKYGRRDRPLKICLNWIEHRQMTAAQIEQQLDYVGLFGELIFLDQYGRSVEATPADENEVPEFNEDEKAKALTALREYLALSTNARVLLGGKREGFQGRMPGLVEEAIQSIRAGQPIFLAGGFGGVTLDIIQQVAPALVSWFPERLGEADSRLSDGLAMIREILLESGCGLASNGLSEEENALLAATYRPSEIAAFVGLGLARLSREKRLGDVQGA